MIDYRLYSLVLLQSTDIEKRETLCNLIANKLRRQTKWRRTLLQKHANCMSTTNRMPSLEKLGENSTGNWSSSLDEQVDGEREQNGEKNDSRINQLWKEFTIVVSSHIKEHFTALFFFSFFYTHFYSWGYRVPLLMLFILLWVFEKSFLNFPVERRSDFSFYNKLFFLFSTMIFTKKYHKIFIHFFSLQIQKGFAIFSSSCCTLLNSDELNFYILRDG